LFFLNIKKVEKRFDSKQFNRHFFNSVNLPNTKIVNIAYNIIYIRQCYFIFILSLEIIHIIMLVYFTDDGHMFTIEEVVEYAIYNKNIYPDWNFSELTGGVENFISKKEYLIAKSVFILKMNNK